MGADGSRRPRLPSSRNARSHRGGCSPRRRDALNEDFLDMLAALLAVDARFVVVGAHAMAVHGVPRATGDLDIWIDTHPANTKKVWQALVRFGAPVASLGVSRDTLNSPGVTVQIGLPPRRIDLLTEITGLDFERAWQSRVVHQVAGLDVPFISRAELIENKRATGRPKDLADLEILESQER